MTAPAALGLFLLPGATPVRLNALAGRGDGCTSGSLAGAGRLVSAGGFGRTSSYSWHRRHRPVRRTNMPAQHREHVGPIRAGSRHGTSASAVQTATVAASAAGALERGEIRRLAGKALKRGEAREVRSHCLAACGLGPPRNRHNPFVFSKPSPPSQKFDTSRRRAREDAVLDKNRIPPFLRSAQGARAVLPRNPTHSPSFLLATYCSREGERAPVWMSVTVSEVERPDGRDDRRFYRLQATDELFSNCGRSVRFDGLFRFMEVAAVNRVEHQVIGKPAAQLHE